VKSSVTCSRVISVSAVVLAVIPKSLSALGTAIVPSLHVAPVVPVPVPSDPELPSLQAVRKARLIRTLIPNKYLRITNSKNIELIN
jgi:hypothetical protein